MNRFIVVVGLSDKSNLESLLHKTKRVIVELRYK